MVTITLLSDNHSHWDSDIEAYCEVSDEVWHAGDIGSVNVLEKLEKYKLRAVYGNIDNKDIRIGLPEEQVFDVEGICVYMTHIGGYPPRYSRFVKDKIVDLQPDLFICGHSHITKVIGDKERSLLHMNPGACGHYGIHVVRTLLMFQIHEAKISNVRVVELGRRGRLK